MKTKIEINVDLTKHQYALYRANTDGDPVFAVPMSIIEAATTEADVYCICMIDEGLVFGLCNITNCFWETVPEFTTLSALGEFRFPFASVALLKDYDELTIDLKLILSRMMIYLLSYPRLLAFATNKQVNQT